MMNTCIGMLFLLGPISLSPSIQRGDMEFGRMNYQAAGAMYDSMLVSSADSIAALWRLARLYVCLGDVAPQTQRLDLYVQAEAFAHRCIRADSMRPEGHTWRAAALGNIAMFEGGSTKVELCRLIKQELDCSVMLNPADDIAWSILGSFYMALGNVTWIERQMATLFLGDLPEGGYEESEGALKKAIALAPGVMRHRFELAALYMEQARHREAIDELRLVVTLPVLLASDERTRLTAAGFIRDLEGE